MKILDFPTHIQIFEYNCGSTALQSVLTYYGINIREGRIIRLAKTNSKEGTTVAGVCRVLKRSGLNAEVRNMTVSDLKAFINKKIPVMMLVQAWKTQKSSYATTFTNGHWVVAIGYDRKKIIFEDPYRAQRTYLKVDELGERWHGKEDKHRMYGFGIAVSGKKPVFRSNQLIHMD